MVFGLNISDVGFLKINDLDVFWFPKFFVSLVLKLFVPSPDWPDINTHGLVVKIFAKLIMVIACYFVSEFRHLRCPRLSIKICRALGKSLTSKSFLLIAHELKQIDQSWIVIN